MASSKDVRDMLGLDPSTAPSLPGKSKKKPKAPTVKGLRGINRELNQLIGERAAPVVVIDSAKTYRAKQNLKKHVRPWIQQPFSNPARSDDLVLRHWRHKPRQPQRDAEDGDTAMGEDVEELDQDRLQIENDYPFAKYNVKIQTPEYTDEQYTAYLQDSTWTREETDYLMEMVREFYQRWWLIIDRWDFMPKALKAENNETTPPPPLPPQEEPTIKEDRTKTEIPSSTDSTQPISTNKSSQDSNEEPSQQSQDTSGALVKQRSLEDLKARYYSICAKMMALKTPGGVRDMNEEEFRQHEILTKYNPAREKSRKQLVDALMKRSMDDIMEEENLVAELQRIMVSQQKLQAERDELRLRLDLYDSKQVDGATFTSSQELTALVNRFMMANRDRKRMSMNGNLRISVGGEGTVQNGNVYANGTPMTAQSRDSFGGMSGQKRSGLGGPMSAASSGGPLSAGGMVKQLSDKDKRRFGVTNYDRLQPGMSFPTDRITKLRSGKSNMQTQKLASALAELGIPDVVSMPVEKVVNAFDSVVSKVLKVMDMKKLLEKEEGEIKVAKHLREERKRRESGMTADESELNGDTTMHDAEEDKTEADAGTVDGEEDADAAADDEDEDRDAEADDDDDDEDDAGGGAVEVDEDEDEDADADGEPDAEGEDEEEDGEADVEIDDDDEEEEADADNDSAGGEDGDADDDADADADGDEEEEEEEEDEDQDDAQESELLSRPTSSHVRPSSNRSRTPMSTRASRKRSASVLSASSGVSLTKKRR